VLRSRALQTDIYLLTYYNSTVKSRSEWMETADHVQHIMGEIVIE